MVKDKTEEGEKARKIWVDGELLYFIALRGKKKLELAKNAKNKVNFVFIL
jgi:hypothetical protein